MILIASLIVALGAALTTILTTLFPAEIPMIKEISYENYLKKGENLKWRLW